jgi:putative peptidoglycan lipid II flippase
MLAMLLKVGIVSLALLLASRLMGLLRESAQAAAFGATGLADLAVLMFSLPDWVAGVMASGALAYVLIPAWTGQARAAVDTSQQRVTRSLILLGSGLALGSMAALALAPATVLGLLAPGLPPELAGAAQGLVWSALALPLALLAALWTTRLQHNGDAVGLYGANLVVNGVLVLAITVVGVALGRSDLGVPGAVTALGLGLLAAMGLRLAWQAWREAHRSVPAPAPATDRDDHSDGRPCQLPLPPPAVWAWAILSAGLPLALPFAARSIASSQGEGALAVFNYAWKLVELPLMLAIQLVATLALPRVAAALCSGLQGPNPHGPLKAAFGLAFVLACAAAAGLLLAADAVARLLFGWGRMGPESLAQVAAWGRVGAWGLLPQAVSAVGLTVLASQRRLRPAAAWHTLALAALLIAAAWLPREGAVLMVALNIVFTLVTLGIWVAIGPMVRALMPWRPMGAAFLALAGVALLQPLIGQILSSWLAQMLAGGVAALVVVAFAWAAGGDWRLTLRR